MSKLIMRTIKVLSLLLVCLMFFQLYALAPVVRATPNTTLIEVSGTVNIVFPGQIIGFHNHTLGDIWYIIAYQSASFSGSFVGSAIIKWFITENLITGEIKSHGIGTFTNESGTFTFTTFGEGLGPTFHSEWKILKGTGCFSNMHGNGTLDADLSAEIGSYLGQIYFRP